jgi:hypothetical protein
LTRLVEGARGSLGPAGRPFTGRAGRERPERSQKRRRAETATRAGSEKHGAGPTPSPGQGLAAGQIEASRVRYGTSSVSS